jgi:hypothetical protein
MSEDIVKIINTLLMVVLAISIVVLTGFIAFYRGKEAK